MLGYYDGGETNDFSVLEENGNITVLTAAVPAENKAAADQSDFISHYM